MDREQLLLSAERNFTENVENAGQDERPESDSENGDKHESNFEACASVDEQHDDDEKFEVMHLSENEKQGICEEVTYCKRWSQNRGLFLPKKVLVERAYAHHREKGLFSLFVNNSYLECVRKWTDSVLMRRGYFDKVLRMDDLQAYLGLELATSICKLNLLKDYWSTETFLGNKDFPKVMSRDKFLHIRSAHRLYANYDADVHTRDPLWHSRQLLEHFRRNAANMAVPVGVNSLDENTIRCKGRTTARSYIKSKPVRFGIRFYAVVGWKNAYLHSIQDNGCGNRTGMSPVDRYTRLFRTLRVPVERNIVGRFVEKGTTFALWCAHVAHQTQLHPRNDVGRLIVMDNFYTRHTLARQIYALTDEKTRVIGTVRLNLVDGINRVAVREAIDQVKGDVRGSWRLCRAYDSEKGSKDPPILAERCECIVFKDRSIVMFYTNDLANTPASRICVPDSHSVQCVHGLAPLHRWCGTESLSRTILIVPSIVVAYNLFMNGVDKFDQLRSTNASERKEHRVPMSILYFILDAALLNSRAVLNCVHEQGTALPTFCTFKRRVAEQLVAPHVEYCQQRSTLRTLQPTLQQDFIVEGAMEELEQHILLENQNKKSVHCMLCKLWAERRTRGGYIMYSYAICQFGFHVNCSTYFHNTRLFRNIRTEIYYAVEAARTSPTRAGRRQRRNLCTSNLHTAKVPFKRVS